MSCFRFQDTALASVIIADFVDHEFSPSEQRNMLSFCHKIETETVHKKKL